MITPAVNTELMQRFIDGLWGHIKGEEHAVLVLAIASTLGGLGLLALQRNLTTEFSS